MTQHNETFNADAAIVWRLGAELFTDGTQALLELVKNSYDADATRVRVEIQRPERGAAKHRFRGCITIADDGHGMSEDAIRKGWLVLSASAKREQKLRAELTTKYKRMPLGDKGLGRLGTQLLGRRLRLRTRPTDLTADPPVVEVEHDVEIDFEAFRQGQLLTGIQPIWNTMPVDGRPWAGQRPWGTILTIEDLWTRKDAEPEDAEDERDDVKDNAVDDLDKNVGDDVDDEAGGELEVGSDAPGPFLDEAAWIDEAALTRRLSVLINPYRKVRKFDLAVSVDGVPLDLVGVSRQVREAALGRWHVEYDGNVLRVRGQLRREWFRPGDAERIKHFQRELSRSSGRQELSRRLAARGPMAQFTVRPGSSPWAIEVVREVRVPEDLEELPGTDPGPFEMELDVVSLQISVAKDLSLTVFDRQADYRAWVKERASVNVYRDGFAVASGHDLLRLGKAFTSGGSFYGLRPQNVMGYVAVSGAKNPQLEETTNREAFRRTPAFERFDALLVEARDVINRALDEAGRTASEYARELSEADHGVLGLTADELADTAVGLVERATTAAATIGAIERVLDVVSEDQHGAEAAADAKQALRDLEEAKRLIASLEQLGPIAKTLRDRITALETAYDELIATAALGIAAEGLAHDLTAVVERLSERARQAKPHADAVPTPVRLALDDVRWAAGALRSQLRHLDPMLRHSRLRRDVLDLGSVVEAQLAYHRPRLASKGIVLRLRKDQPATVRLSPGRLGQALDNLMLNSEYWLEHHPPENEARIDVTVDGHKITVADNGPGVEEEMRDAIFEAFVTRRHEGRGLGLWLTRQLLDADGAAISLQGNTEDGDERRLHRFVIEYPSL